MSFFIVFRCRISWPGLSYLSRLDVVICLIAVFIITDILPIFDPLRLNKDQICKYFQFQRMNGLLFCAIGVTVVLLLYFILQVITCVRFKKHRTQLGTDGLPDLDTSRAPRTCWTELGDLFYVLYRFSCRIWPSE